MLRTRVDCRLEKKNSIKRFRSLALLLSLQRFPFRFEKFSRSNRTNPSPFPFFPPPPISTQLFPKLDFFFVPQSREGRFSLRFSLLRFSIHLSIPRSFSPLKGKKPFSTRVNKSSRREGKKKGKRKKEKEKIRGKVDPQPFLKRDNASSRSYLRVTKAVATPISGESWN